MSHVDFRWRMIQTWPAAKRPADKELSQGWSVGLSAVRSSLSDELVALGVKECLVETDHSSDGYSRLDGSPRAEAPTKTPRVAVWFEIAGKPTAIRCEGHPTWQKNLKAVAMTLKQNRMLRRYGTATVEEQYGGYAALPPPPEAVQASEGFTSPRDAAKFVWECARGNDVSPPNNIIEQIITDGNARRQYHREAARKVHPDNHGGDGAQFSRLTKAMECISRALA